MYYGCTVNRWWLPQASELRAIGSQLLCPCFVLGGLACWRFSACLLAAG